MNNDFGEWEEDTHIFLVASLFETLDDILAMVEDDMDKDGRDRGEC